MCPFLNLQVRRLPVRTIMQFSFALLYFCLKYRYEHECFPMIIGVLDSRNLRKLRTCFPITPFPSPFTHLIFCFRLHYQISHKELSSSLDTKQLIIVTGVATPPERTV